MKKTFFTIAMICAATMMQAQKPAIPRDAALEAKVEKTLAKMTLDEKIGQMLELNFDIMGRYDATGRECGPVAGVDSADSGEVDDVSRHS